MAELKHLPKRMYWGTALKSAESVIHRNTDLTLRGLNETLRLTAVEYSSLLALLISTPNCSILRWRRQRIDMSRLRPGNRVNTGVYTPLFPRRFAFGDCPSANWWGS